MSRAPFLASIAAVAVFLAACASEPQPVKIVTQTVDRPVAVSCVPPDMPPAPKYGDTPSAVLAAPDFAARYALLSENWAVGKARLKLLEGVVADCAKAAPK